MFYNFAFPELLWVLLIKLTASKFLVCLHPYRTPNIICYRAQKDELSFGCSLTTPFFMLWWIMVKLWADTSQPWCTRANGGMCFNLHRGTIMVANLSKGTLFTYLGSLILGLHCICIYVGILGRLGPKLCFAKILRNYLTCWLMCWQLW